MATLPLHNSYRCDQCGTPEIVAVPVLYQQGTRSFSGLFNHGTSQSYSAQLATPPKPKGYVLPILLWGFAVTLFSISSFFDLNALLTRPTIPATEVGIAAIFLSLWLASVGGLVWSLRRIYRYNHDAYPKLHWNWEHTYMCRRCGKFNLIPS
jgi:hypothetical protein